MDDDAVHVVLRDPELVDRVRAATEQLAGPLRGADPDEPVTGIAAAVRRTVRSRLRRRRAT